MGSPVVTSYRLPNLTQVYLSPFSQCSDLSQTDKKTDGIGPAKGQHHSDLHWLPVRGRVDYKIAVLCYKAVKLQQPSYLTCLPSSYRQSRVLRSSNLLSTQSSLPNIAARRLTHHLYALLTVSLSLVLGVSSRPTCSQDICSRSTVRASDTLISVFRALNAPHNTFATRAATLANMIEAVCCAVL